MNMTMKSLPLIIFAIAALAQWGAPLSQIWAYESTLSQGTLIKLKCAAPDPFDPLRGRFLAVSPTQREVPVPEDLELESDTSAYAAITTGPDGLATLTSLSLTPPVSGDYIRVKVTSKYGGIAVIAWPFERFYINEKLAPEADVWFAENIRSDKDIIAEVRVLKGRAVLADLTLEGKSFREILKSRLKLAP